MFTVSIDYYYDCYQSRNFHVKSKLGILYTSLRQYIARVSIRLRKCSYSNFLFPSQREM